MSTHTPNINLEKPSGNERPYVSVINSNSDILDSVIGEVDVEEDGSLAEQVEGVRDSLGQCVTTSNTSSLIQREGDQFQIEVIVGTTQHRIVAFQDSLSLWQRPLNGTWQRIWNIQASVD